MGMKKGAIFGLIFLSFVLVGSFGVVSGQENNFVTETITCKFVDYETGEIMYKDPQVINLCYNFFQYGNVVPSETGQYNCYDNEGTGECSVTIRGERGAKMKWTSFCFERLSDAHIKSYPESISNLNLTTTIDGTDKIIEIECIESSATVTKILSLGWYNLRFFFANLLYSSKVGYRGGYVLCQDGNEFSNINSDSCKTQENVENDLSDLCNNHCNIDDTKCGSFTAYVQQACNLDNPSQNLTIFNL